MSFGRAYGTNGYNQLDIQPAPNHDQGEARRKCVKRCLRAFMCLLPLLLLVLLFEIVSVNVVVNSGNHKNGNRDNYLLLPVNTFLKLPVDADKYGSIVLSSDSSDRDGSNAPIDNEYKKVRFITRAYENGTDGSHGIKFTGECDMSSYKSCIILRYWPLDRDNYHGTFSCSATDSYGDDAYIAWEWFDHRTTFDQTFLYLSSPCPSVGSANTYTCNGDDDSLSVSQMFDSYGPHNGHHLLGITFCPVSDAGTIGYKHAFNESWPALLYRDYDVYPFIGPQELGYEYKATIPLQAEVDSAVYIIYAPVPYTKDVDDISKHVAIRYDLIQNAHHHLTIWISTRERINSVFVVSSIFVICTALIFVMYYIRKNFVIL